MIHFPDPHLFTLRDFLDAEPCPDSEKWALKTVTSPCEYLSRMIGELHDCASVGRAAETVHSLVRTQVCVNSHSHRESSRENENKSALLKFPLHIKSIISYTCRQECPKATEIGVKPAMLRQFFGGFDALYLR